MQKRHLVPVVAALASALAVPAAVAAPTAAAPAPTASSALPSGTRSLAAVLTADGDRFDRNWYDYDIVTEAVLAVLKAKPNSPVSVLTRGDRPVTAFIPNDRAFQVLAADLTHRWYGKESQVFSALVGAVGVDAIESVLLYHVVPGAPISSQTALRSDGARLTTALPGATIKVDVLSRWLKLVRLVDQDRDDLDPLLNPRALDINRGNRQVAHGIVLVLRPLDL
ncbi:fasciclin domain-containing protein [Terrabacter sp. NPDC000476]|uniref:fasciclin domain-containing protein n=1 Tax=Terrabacter sp. NPDC000476 TaxID=3154258 RepID=UPI00331B29F8